jgi:hypothetical protein
MNRSPVEVDSLVAIVLRLSLETPPTAVGGISKRLRSSCVGWVLILHQLPQVVSKTPGGGRFDDLIRNVMLVEFHAVSVIGCQANILIGSRVFSREYNRGIAPTQ